MVLGIALAGVVLSFGGVYAFVPIVIIVILIAAAAGLSRGASIFSAFGIGAIIGLGGSFGGGGRGKALHKQGYGGGAGQRNAAKGRVQGKKFGAKDLKKAGGMLKKGATALRAKKLSSNSKLTSALAEKGREALAKKGMPTDIIEGAAAGGIGFSTMAGSKVLKRRDTAAKAKEEARKKLVLAQEAAAGYGAQGSAKGAPLAAPSSKGGPENLGLLEKHKITKMGEKAEKTKEKLEKDVKKAEFKSLGKEAKHAVAEKKALYEALAATLGTEEAKKLMKSAKESVGGASNTESTSRALERQESKLKKRQDAYFAQTSKADKLLEELNSIKAMNNGKFVKGVAYSASEKHELSKQQNYLKQINKKVEPELYEKEARKLEEMKGTFVHSKVLDDLKKSQGEEIKALKNRQEAEKKSFMEARKADLKSGASPKGQVKSDSVESLSGLEARQRAAMSELEAKHKKELSDLSNSQVDAAQRERLRLISASPDLMLKRIDDQINKLEKSMSAYVSAQPAASKGEGFKTVSDENAETNLPGAQRLAELKRYRDAISSEKKDFLAGSAADREKLLGATSALLKSESVVSSAKTGVAKELGNPSDAPKNLRKMKEKKSADEEAEAKRIRDEVEAERERKAAAARELAKKKAEEEQKKKPSGGKSQS